MIVLDTNIVLEILQKTERYQKVIEFLRSTPEENIAVSTLTLSNVFYIVGDDINAVTVAEKMLKKLETLDVNKEDSIWAFNNYHKKDHEDALQIASAMRNKCTVFVTIDKQLYKKYQKYLNIKLID